MSVAEVRRGLDEMRKKWKYKKASSFFICDMLCNNMTLQEFGYQFVMGHHHKRHNKSQKGLIFHLKHV